MKLPALPRCSASVSLETTSVWVSNGQRHEYVNVRVTNLSSRPSISVVVDVAVHNLVIESSNQVLISLSTSLSLSHFSGSFFPHSALAALSFLFLFFLSLSLLLFFVVHHSSRISEPILRPVVRIGSRPNQHRWSIPIWWFWHLPSSNCLRPMLNSFSLFFSLSLFFLFCFGPVLWLDGLVLFSF